MPGTVTGAAVKIDSEVQPVAGQPFSERIKSLGEPISRRELTTLQINVGKLCNQVCRHCHVDAGPKRTEIMSRETIDRILKWLEPTDIHTVDLTGGAPELIPDFRYLVRSLREQNRHVIVRCNLTVLLEPGQHDTAEFFRDMKVEVISSLPCYSKENVDAQRGGGVFSKSIIALHQLNALGFGMPDSELKLHLVYNPLGPNLPPSQAELSEDYHKHLSEECNVQFNELLTVTNMPIARFADDLERSGTYSEYMQLLYLNFNEVTVEQLMCRSLISVSWDGYIYDCDFNQMLEIPAYGQLNRYLWEVSPDELARQRIAVDDHCYGCTAGAGSSCGGALT